MRDRIIGVNDDEARLRIFWVPFEVTGERGEACEDKGKGSLELWEDQGVEEVTRWVSESVKGDSLDGMEF